MAWGIALAVAVVLAIIGAGVVIYMRSAARDRVALAQQEAQLQEERERRIANDEADRAARVRQETEFAHEATAAVSPSDALKLLRDAQSRLH